MILLHILTGMRLFALLLESILIVFSVVLAFQAINNFHGRKNQKIPSKIFYRRSIPIIVILILPNFLIRFIIEFIGIYTGVLSFGLLHLVVVLLVHLKMYRGDTIQKRTEDPFDFYTQYA